MSEREKIQEKLRRKEAEIQSFEEKIKAARIYAQALRDVLGMLAVDESSVPTEDPADTILRPGSSVAQARDVILRRGDPMHANDILAAIGKDTTREARASLIGSISAYVRKGEIFTRPAPNTFGLVELGHEEPQAEETQPPQGFGGGASPMRSGTRTPTFDPDDNEEDIPF
ncbi:MAG: hypothetical protein Q8L54_14025 [Devosia sp.]|nr:hypothetical protein [Devosia sp.]